MIKHVSVKGLGFAGWRVLVNRSKLPALACCCEAKRLEPRAQNSPRGLTERTCADLDGLPVAFCVSDVVAPGQPVLFARYGQGGRSFIRHSLQTS